MPNKLFDSIQARVGIISGPSPDIRKFCEKNGTGIATEEFSVNSLRSTLLTLSINSINQFKTSCNEAAKVYNAETEARKLNKIITGCLQEKNKGSNQS